MISGPGQIDHQLWTMSNHAGECVPPPKGVGSHVVTCQSGERPKELQGQRKALQLAAPDENESNA